MIIVFACLIVVAIEAIFLRGGLKKLMAVRFRRIYLVWLALVDQVLVISILPGGHHLVLDVANLLSYLAAAAFVWSNRRIPGLLLLGAGGALNLVVIGVNKGTRPASESALEASGWHPAPGHFVNSGVLAHPKLSFLGDIFATPRWMPFHDVFSVGDVVIVLAVGVLVWRTCTKGSTCEADGAKALPTEIGSASFTPAG